MLAKHGASVYRGALIAKAIIHRYQKSDAPSVGVLIADTYSEFNLSFVPSQELDLFLGPFRHARSPEESHKEAIVREIRSGNWAEAGTEIRVRVPLARYNGDPSYGNAIRRSFVSGYGVQEINRSTNRVEF